MELWKENKKGIKQEEDSKEVRNEIKGEGKKQEKGIKQEEDSKEVRKKEGKQ